MDLAPPSDDEPDAPPGRAVGPAGPLATVLSWLALIAFAAAAVLLVIPVEVPEVQDCGAPATYLWTAPVDTVPDAEGRIRTEDGEIVTLPPGVAARARDQPCRERVAARAVPALGLALLGLVAGMSAFSLELFVVRPRRRHAILAARATAPTEAIDTEDTDTEDTDPGPSEPSGAATGPGPR